MRITATRLVNQGSIEITGSSLAILSLPPLEQNSGTITLTDGALSCSGAPTRLNGGSFVGNGTVGAIESNCLIAPRDSGLDFLQSTLTLRPGSVLSFECQSAPTGISF